MRDGVGRLQRVLVLGGASEIGLATLRSLALTPPATVILAGRDGAALERAAAGLPTGVQPYLDVFDALVPRQATQVVERAFDGGDVDLVLPAFGVLGNQKDMESDPDAAADLLTVNLVSQSTVLLAAAGRMRAQGHGTIVVLSSIAGVRARRANFVYGASKAGLDAFGQGLTDSLHGTGVNVVVVRAGFVIGRMTRGMDPAPLATTADDAGRAIASAVHRGRRQVWVPPSIQVVAWMMRATPRPVWRRLPR
jgi:decaprenylphospho-beta-D-erythro-pentofuranosid-2-ulose 2-reductase